VHAHQTYLRLHVALTGQASVYLPCPQLNTPATPAAPAAVLAPPQQGATAR
jgi:hypothetical protein